MVIFCVFVPKHNQMFVDFTTGTRFSSQSHWLIWYWLNIKLLIKGYKDLHCKRLGKTALIRQTDVSGCDNDSSKFSPCIKQVVVTVDGFGKWVYNLHVG